MFRFGCGAVIVISLVCASVTDAYAQNLAYEIGEGPQLFLDDALIKDISNLERVIEHPVKHPDNPLIVPEHPWKSGFLRFMARCCLMIR